MVGRTHQPNEVIEMRLKAWLAAVLSCFLLVPAFAQGGKAQPPRDPKTGRFLKATPTPAPAGKKGGAATGEKKSPARDPKTGKFIKATPAPTGKKGGTATGGKKAPARDPKTGRFIKSEPAKKP
jgi:hypothetical protein